MSTAPKRPADDGGEKLPRSRARTLILVTIALIIVVAFGYMILVSALG
ncbi:hypothetical protein [Modestobacter marinus]|nr:hypothetical protein [Modestobacter marinus]